MKRVTEHKPERKAPQRGKKRMTTPKRDKPATEEPLEKRFDRFAKALMAVPKKELDKELAKDERKKRAKPSKRRD